MIAACAALAAFLPQLVLVVSGDNGQLDWIPTPTPYRVAVGLWDLASRNPIAVLAAAIGVAQLVRSAVPQAAAWKTALVMVWLGAPLAATLLASIAQPAFEARYVLVGLPALALAIGAALVSIPRRWALALGIALVLSASIRLGQHRRGLIVTGAPPLPTWRSGCHGSLTRRAPSGSEAGEGEGRPPERPPLLHTP